MSFEANRQNNDIELYIFVSDLLNFVVKSGQLFDFVQKFQCGGNN